MLKMYSVDEVARALGVSSPTIRRIVRTGDLPAVRIGTGRIKPRIVISEIELENFVARRGIFCGANNGGNEGKI
jgi:excisionase family DNA binding protein